LAKPEWGAKRVCQSCGTKFYDFLRDPILCPSCGATYQPDDALKPRRSRVEPRGRAAAKPVPAEEEAEVEDEEEEEDLLLDEAEEEEEDEEEVVAVVEDDEEEADVDEVPARPGKGAREAPPVADGAVDEDEALVEELAEDEDIDLEEDVEEEFEDEEKER
jgi:uncharacterized protein (TIGR02300 family)